MSRPIGGRGWPHWIFPVLLIAMLIEVYLSAVLLQYFPCPNCGKQFSSRWRSHQGMTFARRRVHCGLPKYATRDTQQS
jgi:hypothetical protein